MSDLAFNPDRTCAYLRDLALNNNRGWFDAHRDRYQTDWLEPAMAYVEALSGWLSTLDPPHKAEAKINGSIRRINRDVRFSKDKSPYDPKLHLVFWTGDHPNRSPALHIVVHPQRAGFGAGHWAMDATTLDRFRRAVLDPSTFADLATVLDGCAAHDCLLNAPDLKRVPRGFEAAGAQADLLKRKALVVRTQDSPLPPATVCDLTIMKPVLTQLAKVNRWLIDHVA